MAEEGGPGEEEEEGGAEGEGGGEGGGEEYRMEVGVEDGDSSVAASSVDIGEHLKSSLRSNYTQLRK